MQQSQFTIGQHQNHLVRVILHKQAFFPGDTLLVSFDFAAATMACDSVKGALVLEEHLCEHSLEPGKKVATTALETVIEVTADLLQTNVCSCAVIVILTRRSAACRCALVCHSMPSRRSKRTS